MPIETWEILGNVNDTQGGTREIGFSSRTLTEGRSAGVHLVSIHCGQMSVDILPTRGMGIWRANCAGLPVGWDSPVRGPVHPAWVPISDASGLGWLEGFDEMMVRCGLRSNGAPQHDENGMLQYPLHGRIANLPARDVTVELDHVQGVVRITAVVEESRFLFYRLQLRSTIELNLANPKKISITDCVTNLGGTATDFQLLYHTNIGSPVLDTGATFHAPINDVSPRDPRAAAGMPAWSTYGPPENGFAEQVYFLQLAADERAMTTVLLENHQQTAGVSMEFNVRQLPCFTLWKNTAAVADGYVTGLEPGTNFPNPRGHEESAGRTVSLDPNNSAFFEFSISAQTDGKAVERVRDKIRNIGGTQGSAVNQPI